MLKICEVAEVLGISISHVRRLVSTGALPAHRVGVRALRIGEADIAAFLATRRRGK
jgi:excisionase family DNA binding protein